MTGYTIPLSLLPNFLCLSDYPVQVLRRDGYVASPAQCKNSFDMTSLVFHTSRAEQAQSMLEHLEQVDGPLEKSAPQV